MKNNEETNSIDFTNSIHIAEEIGIKIAWSNDVFELWVLLHFEKLPADTKIHRDEIYDRLTQIFLNLENKSPKFTEITAHKNFSYKAILKSNYGNNGFVLPIIKNKTEVAIKNAKALDTEYLPHIPFHDRNPCTQVYKLVEELLAFDN